jgi:RNA polymerase sigma-70 factor, ECF subfamily
MTLLCDDRALLEAFRRGERAALGAVYAAYAGQVTEIFVHGFQFDSQGRTMRFRGFSDPLELEQFVQDAFLRAFSEKARLAYDGVRPYAPYLLRLAKNVVIDELRRRKTAVERLCGPYLEGTAADTSADPAPDEECEAKQARQLVRDFLATRSALERRFVELRFAQDRPLLAAARELGMTRMRARLLEEGLRRALGKYLCRSTGGDLSRAATLACWGVL